MLQQESDAVEQPDEDRNKEVAAVEKPSKKDKEKVDSFINKSSELRIAVHGMSSLINTRLSSEALQTCLALIEAGVHSKALADIVMHILDDNAKRQEAEHGNTQP
ncbi:uncharacterized protein LOC6567486 [Drosophila grimshawi]|uniref:GH19672 n=1 Tax=Drosophila grimshawi TaxID=7222 RepID=B4JRQ3_DROGR|nr:uncharacterized protein LOC6567486 [Drosophila grimshawi]XP_032596155.1 uncharacterized protein LOC6567486 [Drosophila grimshawi]EDV94443.1 GH19672 [Drosophila grimshawi]